MGYDDWRQRDDQDRALRRCADDDVRRHRDDEDDERRHRDLDDEEQRRRREEDARDRRRRETDIRQRQDDEAHYGQRAAALPWHVRTPRPVVRRGRIPSPSLHHVLLAWLVFLTILFLVQYAGGMR